MALLRPGFLGYMRYDAHRSASGNEVTGIVEIVRSEHCQDALDLCTSGGVADLGIDEESVPKCSH